MEFPRFPSGAGGEVCRNAQEVANKMDCPKERQEKETSQDLEHRGIIKAIVRRKVGANGQKGAEEENEQHGATEPGHLRGDETKRCFAASGRQPIGLVRKIDLLVRARGNQSRRKESDHAGQAHYHQHHQKKCVLGLPAVGHAVEVEMCCHSLREQWIVAHPLKKARDEHEKLNNFGEARIVHGSSLASGYGRGDKPAKDLPAIVSTKFLPFLEQSWKVESIPAHKNSG